MYKGWKAILVDSKKHTVLKDGIDEHEDEFDLSEENTGVKHWKYQQGMTFYAKIFFSEKVKCLEFLNFIETEDLSTLKCYQKQK